MKPSTIATSVSSHSRVKTESTLPPRTTRSAGSSPRATARRRERAASIAAEPYSSSVDVLTPRTLDEALRLQGRAARRLADPGRDRPDGRAQLRPRPAGDDAEPERGRGAARLVARERLAAARRGPDLRRDRARRAARSCCPRSPRRRARSARRRSATAARSAATSAPRHRPATRCRRSCVEGAEVECASVRGTRRVPLADFVTGVKRNALEPDELIAAVWLTPSNAPQTFMKVGPRNAMVIAVVSLARLGGRRAARVVRLGRAAAGARDGAARRGRLVPGARRRGRVADRRRARHARPTAVTRCAC